MKKITTFIAVLVLTSVFAVSLMAQTPQYYNFNSGATSNSFPFNQSGGKAVNTLFLPGAFINPSPLPTGNAITTVYIRTSTAGTRDFTDLQILMAQSTITDLTSSVFYGGPWDTVYNHSSATLTSTAGGWMSITLDHNYTYDPTKSLIIFVSHCGATGSGMSVYNSPTTGIKRVWSVGGCPFSPYASGDESVVNFGVDVVPVTPTPTCTYTASTWTPLTVYPNLPAATYFATSSWIGDDLYVQAPTSTSASSTTVYKYTLGGSWTTATPCLTAVTGASMSTCGGKLYLIGGGTSGVTTGSTNVQEFNPSTNTWTAKADLPTALSAHGSVCWGDSVIFVVGGPYTSASTNLNVYYYRPATDTWGTIANSLPSGQGRRTFALGISDNKIIMTCGYNGAYLKSTYVGTIGADASQITWAAAPDAPVALSRPAGTAYESTFFLVGGDTNGTAVKNDKVFLFDVNGNIWNGQIINNPNPVSNLCNGVTAHCWNDTTRIFQPGGYTGVASNIFAVTGYGDVFVGIKPNHSTNSSFELSQNYPNPFNQTTTISYNLVSKSDVMLKVYDIMGNEVTTLVNANQTAGKYEIKFDASKLASGIYVYQLITNNFSQSKRMMVEK